MNVGPFGNIVVREKTTTGQGTGSGSVLGKNRFAFADQDLLVIVRGRSSSA